MPKRVDHDHRRRQLAEALLRAAGSRGLHAVSLRDVAREAEVSVPLIQHYFSTKDELLLFTLDHLAEDMTERVGRRVRSAGTGATPRAILEAILVEALPTTERSRLFHLVYTSTAVLAFTDEALAARPLLANPNAMEDFLLRQLDAARTTSRTQDLDLQIEVTGLLAMSAGLGTSVLLGHKSADEAAAVIRYHLDRLLP